MSIQIYSYHVPGTKYACINLSFECTRQKNGDCTKQILRLQETLQQRILDYKRHRTSNPQTVCLSRVQNKYCAYHTYVHWYLVVQDKDALRLRIPNPRSYKCRLELPQRDVCSCRQLVCVGGRFRPLETGPHFLSAAKVRSAHSLARKISEQRKR